MGRTLLLVSSLLILQCSYAQVNKHGYPCGGMDILDVGLHVKGFKVQHQNDISVSFLKKGFNLALKDTTYNLLRFVIVYTNKKNHVSEYQIAGSLVNKKKAKFIKNIQAGEFLSIECVNVEKLGEESISTTLWISVTE